jgi:replication factor C small subunit
VVVFHYTGETLAEDSIFDKNWDEKYKPTTMADVYGQPRITAKIANFVKRGRLPHMLFAGPPGVGKTSIAKALARDLFGSDWKVNFQEYNASSSRGIDFIRSEIQTLTSNVPVGAAFHIIFLDEADALTEDAQTALRQIMMKHTDTAKFILGCNYVHKIIEPIKDRCAVLRFGRLTEDVITSKLIKICENEKITYDDGVLELISSFSKGSLRKAIQHVEVYVDVNNKISYDFVASDLQLVKDEDMKELLFKAFRGDIEAYQMQLFRLYYDGGFCAPELLEGLLAEIVKLDVTPKVKQALIIHTAEYDWRISQGSNDLLQMQCYLGTLHGIVNQL